MTCQPKLIVVETYQLYSRLISCTRDSSVVLERLEPSIWSPSVWLCWMRWHVCKLGISPGVRWVQSMLRLGADPNQLTPCGWSALIYGARGVGGGVGYLPKNLLQRKDIKVNRGTIPAQVAKTLSFALWPHY